MVSNIPSAVRSRGSPSATSTFLSLFMISEKTLQCLFMIKALQTVVSGRILLSFLLLALLPQSHLHSTRVTWTPQQSLFSKPSSSWNSEVRLQPKSSVHSKALCFSPYLKRLFFTWIAKCQLYSSCFMRLGSCFVSLLLPQPPGVLGPAVQLYTPAPQAPFLCFFSNSDWQTSVPNLLPTAMTPLWQILESLHSNLAVPVRSSYLSSNVQPHKCSHS